MLFHTLSLKIFLIRLYLIRFVLTFVHICTQNISPGMKLLGVITEVNQKDIVISLPGGLRGLVRASEASDFTDLGIEVTAVNYYWLSKFAECCSS